jgi:hypothetical protein
MSKLFLTVFILAVSSISFADNNDEIIDGQEVKQNGKKIIYTYKQFEKFDFDDLTIEGEAGAPNDISVSSMHERPYSNRLPYRKSFTVEIKKGIERVR